MKYGITCTICGSLFDSPKNNAKYCSDDCRRIGAQTKRREWLDRNPDYNKIAGKRFRAGQRMERQKRHEQYLKDKKEAIERATGGKFL